MFVLYIKRLTYIFTFCVVCIHLGTVFAVFLSVSYVLTV